MLDRAIRMVNFDHIRGETVEGQRHSFEQMVCHLARLEDKTGTFRRVDGSGGDGGVEALRMLGDGSKVGFQAKYYPVRDDIAWGKIEESVKTALTNHPELKRYVIALPCDFTGKRAARGGSTEGLWGKWDTQVKHWNGLAAARGMDVVFEPWTAFELEVALLRPEAEHLLRYFFDGRVFTREWMQRHLERTRHDLHGRYSPDEHVPTESMRSYEVIFHRDQVRQDLNAIFDLAQLSDPIAAAALLGGPAVAAAAAAAEDARKAFLELRAAVDAGLERPWPVRRWAGAWFSLTRLLMDLVDHSRERSDARNAGHDDDLHQGLADSTKVYKLIGPEVFGGRWAYVLPVEETRAALFVGRAGAGKSHVLARMAEDAWKAGGAVLHILGQHVLEADPRISIVQLLDLPGWSFHETLCALNLTAEAAKSRALVIIDALNEGRGVEIWRHHLLGFVREVNRHERIILVLSCREEYLDYVVPKDLIYSGVGSDEQTLLGRLVQVPVAGFRTAEEREMALAKFMDANGIARPTAPVLDEEFFNPLFMTSVCRSMAKADIKVFPRGLHGARDIFAFVLETKAKALGTPYDGGERAFRALLASLNDLAALMVGRRTDHVPLHEATGVIDRAFEALPLSNGNWRPILEGSDILRLDVENPAAGGAWSRPDEVVRFSFQRLQDNLIADHLVRICEGEALEDGFGPQAPLAFLVKRSIREDGAVEIKLHPRWVGVFAALWCAVAEAHGKELWDLRSLWGRAGVYYTPDEIRPVFRSSIRERSASAFSPRTRALLNDLWQDDEGERLAILILNACVPEHAWNADFLTERLLSMSRDERNSAWSRWFDTGRSELVDRAREIMQWSIEVNVRRADADVLRLAGLTLIWLLTAENAAIREEARKGLYHLLAGVPALLASSEAALRAVDDPNIRTVIGE
jgi:hypothetical protein